SRRVPPKEADLVTDPRRSRRRCPTGSARRWRPWVRRWRILRRTHERRGPAVPERRARRTSRRTSRVHARVAAGLDPRRALRRLGPPRARARARARQRHALLATDRRRARVARRARGSLLA